MSNSFDTDEDKMIHKLKVHKNLVSWILGFLQREQIPSERTKGNNPNGDIFYYNEEDDEKVRKVVKDLNKKYNP